jgi:hypothetical protein
MNNASIPKDTIIYAHFEGYLYHYKSCVTKEDGKIIEGYQIISLEDAKARNLTLCPKCARIGETNKGGDTSINNK